MRFMLAKRFGVHSSIRYLIMSFRSCCQPVNIGVMFRSSNMAQLTRHVAKCKQCHISSHLLDFSLLFRLWSRHALSIMRPLSQSSHFEQQHEQLINLPLVFSKDTAPNPFRESSLKCKWRPSESGSKVGLLTPENVGHR